MAKSLLVLFLAAAVMLVCLPAYADTVLFSDDLEQGSGYWTVYPGDPTCTSPALVSTATDPNGNHTPGGSNGLKLTQASDRVHHDVNLSAITGNSVKFTCWYYDTLDNRPGSFESFDIRSQDSSYILGIGAYYSDSCYSCRVLSELSHYPNWIESYIPRSAGWHQFDIYQYRYTGTDKAEFFVDGRLATRYYTSWDSTLDRIVLGLGWSSNKYQAGYVDDISYSLVPEPGSFLALAGGLVGLVGLVRRKRA